MEMQCLFFKQKTAYEVRSSDWSSDVCSSDLVANVAHELRTPLTVVHGYLDMLDPEEQPEWAPILEEMRRQSQRMTQLVEDLLTLSRLEAQDGVVDEDVSMGSMLVTLRREAEALSQRRHAITVDDDAGVDLIRSLPELHSAFSQDRKSVV